MSQIENGSSFSSNFVFVNIGVNIFFHLLNIKIESDLRLFQLGFFWFYGHVELTTHSLGTTFESCSFTELKVCPTRHSTYSQVLIRLGDNKVDNTNSSINITELLYCVGHMG